MAENTNLWRSWWTWRWRQPTLLLQLNRQFKGLKNHATLILGSCYPDLERLSRWRSYCYPSDSWLREKISCVEGRNCSKPAATIWKKQSNLQRYPQEQLPDTTSLGENIVAQSQKTIVTVYYMILYDIIWYYMILYVIKSVIIISYIKQLVGLVDPFCVISVGSLLIHRETVNRCTHLCATVCFVWM